MKVLALLTACAVSASLLSLGCGPDAGMIDPATRSEGTETSLATARYSEWSLPVNLGSPVNRTTSIENSPELSKDGLSLYFGSNRTGAGGFGSIDLYVSQRACADTNNSLCRWGEPVNLGSVINTSSVDGGPTLSRDGHQLFLISDRPGGLGSNDIWISWRTNVQDDFGWGPPLNLGPPVNTNQLEAGPNPRGGELYFHHGPAVGNTDIYVSRMRGDVFDSPILVEALSSPGFFDQRPSIRFDGREIILSSDRPGGLGLQDIWASTRDGNGQEWTIPVNLGSPINTEFQEQTPMISEDGTVLLFASNRTGNFDIYIATRTVNSVE